MNTRTRYSRFAILYLVVLLAALPVLSCLVSTPAQAATSTIYVDASVTVGAANGTSWSDAYTTLQDALADSAIPPAAGNDVEIRVAAGVYYPDEGGSATNNDRDETFQLVNSVAIYGGYPAGGGTTRNPYANVTILSGDIDKDDTSGNNAYHVVTASGTNNTAVLDGFTITGGYAQDGAAAANGGGVYNTDGSASFVNVTISGNRTDNLGGGVFNSGNVSFVNVTISDNQANRGGGVFTNSGSPSFTNVTISSNTANFPGGGVDHDGGSASFTNVTISGNSSSNTGGGVVHGSGSASFTNVTISGNAAGFGGGVYNAGGTPTFTNVTISGNNASDTGGGVNNSGGTVTLQNSIIWGNNTQVSGSPTINESLVQGGYASGTNIISADPQFVAQQSPGQSTAGDYRLKNGSPAIDAGDNTLIPGGITTDLDGNPRIFNTTVDLGAYEFQGCPAGTTLFVDQAVVGGSNNGTTWADAFTSLQDALYRAPTCSTITEIWVAKGVYYPDDGGSATDGDPAETFQLINNIAIYGGYPAGGGTRDPETNVTILSGDIDENDTNTDGNNIAETWNDIQEDNANHVVVGSGTDSTAVLDGFTITAGNADGSSGADAQGGGMYNDEGSPTLKNVTFSGNRANEWGGGLRNDKSSPTLTNVTFTGNQATNGGGIENYNNSMPTLTNVTFSRNTATNKGGGMYTSSGSSYPVLRNVIFVGNQANEGGGMHSVDNLATLTNVVFVGNVATSAGGGLYNHSSDAELTNVTFASNQATNNGGGIYNKSSAPTLHNSLLWGNAAANGSQVYNESSDPTYRYSLVEGETAAALDASGSDGTDNLDSADPLFVRDPGPGSDTTWGTTDDDYGDLRLQFGSPAIDAGYNNYLDETSTGIDMNGDGDTDDIISTDLDDSARIINTIVDLGAYEYPLSMRKTVNNNTPAPGDIIEYTLAITSGMNTSSAIITDTLPAELSLVGQVTINPGNTQTTPSNLPRLAASVSVATDTATIVTYQVQVADDLLPGTVLTNTAEVSSDEVATPVTTTIPITIAAAPAIEVSKIASTSSAEVGDKITYTYRVTNTGNLPLTAISAVDDMLGSLDVSDTLAINQSMMTTMVYTPTADDMPGPITNTVTVTGTWSYDGTVDQVTDTHSATVALGNAQSVIAVQKTASVSSARPGDVIIYTYRVTNTGTMLLNPVTAEDDPLGSVTLSSSSLAPGEETTGTLSYTVQLEDLPGPLVNTVTATGTLPGGSHVSAIATVSVDLNSGENVPTITTDPATNVLTTSATLHATVNPNGSDTTVTFAWGEAADGSYPNKQTIAQTFSGTRAQTTSLTISNLTPDTTYSYTATASNANGSTTSNEQRFTTLAADGPAYASTPAPGSTLDAGTVAVSATGTVDLVVREVGSENLTISLPTSMLSGVGAGSFSVQNAANFPLTIADGSGITETITIACTPPAVGVQQATLTLETNDPAHASVSYPLRCTGTRGGPALTIYLPLIFK